MSIVKFFIVTVGILLSSLVSLANEAPEENFRKRRKIDFMGGTEVLECFSKPSDAQALTQSTAPLPELCDDILLHIFKKLPIQDLGRISQVCKKWKILVEEPTLWKVVRYIIKGDYPEDQANKKNAIRHWLRVTVNLSSDLDSIERLVSTYNLNKRHPFANYQSLLMNDAFRYETAFLEEKVAQGNEAAIERKIFNLSTGCANYECDVIAAVEFNEELIEEGNEAAIARKVWGLSQSEYGYDEDPEEAAEFNEELVEEDNEAAIERKVWSLAHGSHGYEADEEAAVALNEKLIAEGNEAAVNRKIKGIFWRFKNNRSCRIFSSNCEPKLAKELAISLNEDLVKKGNEEAIKRKIKGFVKGQYGYEQNIQNALTLNEELVEQGNEAAIERKLEGFIKGKYGYQEDSQKADALYEELIMQENAMAVQRKFMEFVSNWNKGEEYRLQLRNWIEQESIKKRRWAYYLKAQGLKYGILGFSQDRTQATEYITTHSIPY